MTESTVESSAEAILDVAKTGRIRVLHVDDDLTFLSIAKQCLEMQGEIDVDTVSSVNEASEKLKKTDYDVVVCDYQMPGKDGLEFLKELRANGNNTPFIVFTGKGREEIAIKALNCGADQYVDKHGDPETVYCELAHSIRTASGSKRAEEAKRRSEQRYGSLLESISDSVCVLDREWRHVIVNEAGSKFTHSPKDKLLGNKLTDLFPDVEKTPFFAAFKRVMETRKPETASGKYVFEDGREGWYEVHVYPVPEGILCISTDITNRKKTEEELRESEEKLRNVFVASPDAITVTDLNGNIVECNQATVALHGYESKEELIGKNSLELIAKKDHKRAIEGLKETLEHGSTKNLEYTFLTKDGSEFPAELNASVVRDASGKPEYFMAMTKDITERKKAEEEMRKSEVILQNITDSIIVTDLQGRITSWNEGASKIFGFSAKEMLGENIAKVSKPKEREQVAPAQLEQVRKGVLFSGEWEGVRKDGEPVWLMLTTKLLKNSQGETIGMIGVGKDITERRKAEKETESMAKFPAQNPEPVLRISSDGTLLYANQASQNLLKESQSKKDRTLIEASSRHAADALSSNEHSFFEGEHDGRIFLFNVVPVASEGYANLYVTDITERKQMEKQLKESEEKYRNLVENCQDAIAIVNFKGNVLFANKAAERLTGYTLKEGKGLNIRVVTPKRYWPKSVAMLLKARMGKPIPYFEYELKRKDGTIVPVETGGQAIFEDGKPVAIQIITREVTERRKTEEALRQSEEKHRDLFENAMDVILTLDLKGSITAVNNSVLRFGYKKEDLVGKNLLDFVSKEYWPAVMRDFSKVARGEPAKNETELVVPAGKILVEYHAGAIVKENNVAGVQINIRDVTERKKSEELLRESEERFRGLFESIQDPVGIFVGREGRLIDYNTAFKKSSGYTDEELKGKAFLDFVHPDDHAMVLEKYQTKYSEEELPLAYEIRGMNKKGESIPLELSVSTYKKKGKVIGIEVIHRDLTERKKAEKERREIMEKVQMMNEKLRVVGGLTRHDVNNKLTALTGNVYLARKKLSGNSEVLDYLKQVEASIEQTVRIFDFAKAYEVLGVEELAYVDVEKTVDEAVSLFPSLKDIKVVNDCHGLTVLADSLLSQLFCNLIDNSLKYGEKTQQIRVYHKKPSADQLEIVYEDDGVGIPDNMRSNLFKEGFTSGKGTGYGLFMMKRIIEVYGWDIQETGIQGKGVRFVITMPKTDPNGKENYRLV